MNRRAPRLQTGDGLESDDAASSGYGFPVDPVRLFRAMLAGKKWILGAALVGLALGALGAKLLPRTYRATAVVRYDDSASRETPDHTAQAVMARAVLGALEAVQSEAVLLRVKRTLGLDVPTPAVAASIETTPEPDNGILRITMTDDSARGAARRANLVVQVLLDHLRNQHASRIRDVIADLDRRVSAEESALGAARTAYDAFRGQHGISDLTTEQQHGIQSAVDLRSQRDLARSEIQSLEARIAQLRRDLARAPRMVAATASSESVEGQQLQRVEAELATARGVYSSDHPTVRSLELQAQNLRRRVQSGQATIAQQLTFGASGARQTLESALASSEAELAAARQRLNGLESMATEAQTRVAEFSAIEGQAAELLGAVRVHETILVELRDRRARLDSMLRRQDLGFAVARPAVPPAASDPPKKKLFVFVGVPALLVSIAMLVLGGREVGRGRLKTASEIAYWGRGPVIGATTWPTDLHALDDLIADMDDFAPTSRGRTLVVAAMPSHAVLAQAVALRLGVESQPDYYRDDEPPPDSGHPRSDEGTSEPPARGPYPPSHDGTTLYEPIVTPPPARASARPASDDPPPPIELYPSGSGAVARAASAPPAAAPGVGLARIPRAPLALRSDVASRREIVAWDGPNEGPSLRRAARLADRVAVVVGAGAASAVELRHVPTRLGRTDGVAYIVVDVPTELADLPDRVGPVAEFWDAARIDA